MEDDKQHTSKPQPGESLRQMFVAFGEAFGEVLDDPELKEKAKEFGDAATYSALSLGRRFQDEAVKERFRQAGEAAQVLGKSVAEYFKSERKT